MVSVSVYLGTTINKQQCLGRFEPFCALHYNMESFWIGEVFPLIYFFK